MSGTVLDTESISLRVDDATITAMTRRPTTDRPGPPSMVVTVCDPLPLAGDASADLTEAIIDGLLEANLDVTTYEPACHGLILDDFDTYSATQALAELHAVWDAADESTAASREAPAARGLIAVGVGAIIAIAALPRLTGVNRLCLVNPATIDRVTGALARAAADDARAVPLPRAFIDTVSNLESAFAQPTSAARLLCLGGAADTSMDPADTSALAAAARTAGWRAQAVQVTAGDHAFTDPQARLASLELITSFFANGT